MKKTREFNGVTYVQKSHFSHAPRGFKCNQSTTFE